MGAGVGILKTTKDEKDLLATIWEEIKTHSFPADQWNLHSLSRKNGIGWKVVRVFVSSTFTDFFAEREVLVKYIFPKLREWCEQRKILLVEVDLRWGVPAESSTETILRACLGEIERCIEENSIPFFVNMLGQRYGWVPTRDQIPDDVFEEFQWRLGASVTHMEILRAAFRADNPRAFFLFRNGSYIYSLPESFSSQFVDVAWSSKLSMDLLKHSIRERYGEADQVVDYNLSVNGIDTTSGLPKLTFTGLDFFGQKVFEFLKRAISTAYPESCCDVGENLSRTANNDLAEKQAQLDICQDYFCDQRLRNNFIGRDRLLATIFAYCRGDTSPRRNETDNLPIPPLVSAPTVLQPQGSENTELREDSITSSAPFVLFTEDSGTGLSTVLAIASSLITSDTSSKEKTGIQIPSTHALYHSMQAYDDDLTPAILPMEEAMYLNVTRLLVRIILKFGSFSLIESFFASFDLPARHTVPYESAVSFFSKLFSSPEGFREDISIAAPACLFVDTFESSENHLLSHFPSPLPPFFRIVVSTHSSSVVQSCIEQFSLTDHSHNIRTISPLESALVGEVITALMRVYNKRLDSTQLRLLVERSQEARNNLHWVYMACEEVRMFGAFETVTTYISNLPTNLIDLFQLYLSRIVQAAAMAREGTMEYSLRDSLLLLLASSSGLIETELMEMLPISRVRQTLSSSSSENIPCTPLPFSEWTNVYLFLKPLIHITCPQESWHQTQYRPRFTFRNYQVREAVTKFFTSQLSEGSSSSSSSLAPLLAPYWRDLVTFFRDPSRDLVRQAEELPWHLIHLEDHTSLYHFIRAGTHFCLPWNRVLHFINFLRCPQSSRPFSSNNSSQGPPYPERMCSLCSMKSTFHPSRINKMSCGICGQVISSVFWTSNGESSVKLNPFESYLFLCRTHNSKAYLDQKIFKPDCFVCRLPIGMMKMSFPVVICRLCQTTGNGTRCGYLKH